MKYTDHYLESLDHADAVAFSFGSEQLEPFHLLLGVLTIENCDATRILEACGVTQEWVQNIMLDIVDVVPYKAHDFMDDEIPAGPRAMKILDNAVGLADSMKTKVDASHIALALLHRDAVTRTLVSKRCPPEDIYRVLSIMILEKEAKKPGGKFVNQVIIEEME